ncbi:Chymotrypsin-2 [Blattella germanica]|nr:Chymotrypsin-2 [Blattella germanica]
MKAFVALSLLALAQCAFGSDYNPLWSSRVVGGSNAQTGEFPFQVSLRSASSNSHFCGGSIISSDYVLTAAHCVDGSSGSSIVVVTGSIHLNSGGARHGVSRVTYPGWSLPNNLQRVDLQAISNDNCQSSHSGTIYSTSICASAGAGKGVCNGDSGGPLSVNGKIVGIVSWGRPCATGVPDVYTRVSEYVDWIKQNAV